MELPADFLSLGRGSVKTNCKEFVNFLFYDFSTYWMESSQFLSYRFTSFLKVQIVLNHSGRNAKHVGMTPCKDIREFLHK